MEAAGSQTAVRRRVTRGSVGSPAAGSGAGADSPPPPPPSQPSSPPQETRRQQRQRRVLLPPLNSPVPAMPASPALARVGAPAAAAAAAALPLVMAPCLSPGIMVDVGSGLGSTDPTCTPLSRTGKSSDGGGRGGGRGGGSSESEPGSSGDTSSGGGGGGASADVMATEAPPRVRRTSARLRGLRARDLSATTTATAAEGADVDAARLPPTADVGLPGGGAATRRASRRTTGRSGDSAAAVPVNVPDAAALPEASPPRSRKRSSAAVTAGTNVAVSEGGGDGGGGGGGGGGADAAAAPGDEPMQDADDAAVAAEGAEAAADAEGAEGSGGKKRKKKGTAAAAAAAKPARQTKAERQEVVRLAAMRGEFPPHLTLYDRYPHARSHGPGAVALSAAALAVAAAANARLAAATVAAATPTHRAALVTAGAAVVPDTAGGGVGAARQGGGTNDNGSGNGDGNGNSSAGYEGDVSSGTDNDLDGSGGDDSSGGGGGGGGDTDGAAAASPGKPGLGAGRSRGQGRARGRRAAAAASKATAPRDVAGLGAAAEGEEEEAEMEEAATAAAEAAAGPQPATTHPVPPVVPNLGYACLCTTLREYDIFASRDTNRAGFHSRGLQHVSRLALANARDLLPLLQWNEAHGIRLFRLSSGIFPWMSFYTLEELPDAEAIKQVLAAAGAAASRYGHRITFHPSEFTKIASDKPEVVETSIKELEVHSAILDLMGFLPATPHNKINIHVGGVYGDKIAAMDRFVKVVLERLSPNCRARLTVENDDRPSMYSVRDLTYLAAKAHIPIVFDFHHHRFCTGGLSEEAAFRAALATWPPGVRPLVHWSESQEGRRPHAHSDYVSGPINLYGMEAEVDVMIESKAKELALLHYREAALAGRQAVRPEAAGGPPGATRGDDGGEDP